MKKNYAYSTILLFVFVLFSQNIKATDYYLRSNVTAPTSLSAWTQDPTGATAVGTPTTFTGAHIWHFRNRASATISAPFNISTAATASVGSGGSNFNLTVTGNTPIGGQIAGLIDITSTGTVTVNNAKTYKWNLLDVSSLVVFNFSTAFMRFTTNHYGNVTIATSCSLESPYTGDIYVDGLLTINASQVLSFNGNGIFLNGTNGSIAGTGSFSSDANGYIAVLNGNGGNNGTINFSTATGTINGLYLLYNSGADHVQLGSNISLTGGMFHSVGSIDLNGHSLTTESTADISFPAVVSDGYFIGSSTSALIIKGTVGASGGTDMFMDPSNNTLGALCLNSAASLGAGNAVKIADSLSILNGGSFTTNGNVTLVSTSSLKGRLSRVNGTISGNLTVQTFALGGNTDWTVLGVSGISGKTFNDWYGQIPMAIDGSATDVTSANGQYFESVQGWNEADAYGYDTTLVVTSPNDPGVGHWVYLGTGLTTTSDMLWTVSGTPVTGAFPINLTKSAQAGFNLIANPYASPISWASLRNGNASVVNAIYIYSPDHQATTSWNGVVSSHPGGANNVIPMGQGFYVEVTGNTSLTAQESNKVSSNTGSNQLLRSASTSNNSLVRLKVKGGGYEDYSVVLFHSNATNNFDVEYDAHKMNSAPSYVGYPGAWLKSTMIATQFNNDVYSINTIPFAQVQNAVIPVLVKVYASGQHTISANDIENLPPNACVKLFDKLTNTTHDLRNSAYVCNINDTTSVARFELTICADITANTEVNKAPEVTNNIFINRDATGYYVDFDYKNQTSADIIVTNILGQKIMDTKNVKVRDEKVYLNIKNSDQLIFISVTTGNERVTRKFVNNN